MDKYLIGKRDDLVQYIAEITGPPLSDEDAIAQEIDSVLAAVYDYGVQDGIEIVAESPEDYGLKSGKPLGY